MTAADEKRVLVAMSGGVDSSVAAALSVFVDQASESRAIAADALEKYKELTMLYALSDRLFTLTEVEAIDDDWFRVVPDNGTEFKTRTVFIAGGVGGTAAVKRRVHKTVAKLGSHRGIRLQAGKRRQ